MSQPENTKLLSLAMIVKNESYYLPLFIQQHQHFFDEWIIVDTGSSDKTLDIIREHNLPVHQFKWTGDFAAARNYALSQCSGKWVAALDADEQISVEDQAQLRHCMQTQDQIDGIEIKIHNYIQEEDVTQNNTNYLIEYTPPDGSFKNFTKKEEDFGYRETTLMRFFRRDRGYHWKSPVHETLVSPNDKPKMANIQGACIHHFGMLNKELKANDKTAMYKEISQSLQKTIDSSEDPKALFEAARFLEDQELRLKTLYRAMNHAPQDTNIKKLAIDTCLQLNRMTEAVELCQQWIRHDPQLLQAHLTLSQCYLAQNKSEQALKSLKSQIPLFRKHALFLFSLAQIHCQRKEWQEAKSYAAHAYQLSPQSPMIVKLHQKLNPSAPKQSHV